MLLLFASVGERIAYSGRVMPGVDVGGAALAGKSEDAAYAQLTRIAKRMRNEPIRASARGVELLADPAALGLRVDAAATLRAARRAGRSRNPLAQVSASVLRRVRDDRVPLQVTYDHEALEGLLDGWTRQTGHGIVEGDLQFDGTDVTEVLPHAGTGILRDEARRLILDELRSVDRHPLTLPIGRVEPQVTATEVHAAARRARTLLASNVVVRAGTGRVTITPAQLASTLVTGTRGHHLEVFADADRLRFVMHDQLAKFVTAPVDAHFEVTSAGGVNVVPSQPGTEVDVDAVANDITDGRRDITAPMRSVQPGRDTKWARKLGIKELVSTFTTYHPAGQARVVNIHRAADLINNTVVEPGQVFSLNDAIGPRTSDRGFVSAPVFYGEFTEDFGGGVSQLATTVFNAVFFGGFEDITHKPHTIYISRYPMGRESTINYGTVDVKFRNNSHHGVLIRTSYTSSSITVSFYGDKEGKVVKAEGPNVLATRPPTDELIDWPLLPVGERKQVEHGYTGYDVENFRIIEQPGKPTIRQRFFWRYKMIPNKILVGTAKPPPSTTPPRSGKGGKGGKTTTTTKAPAKP